MFDERFEQLRELRATRPEAVAARAAAPRRLPLLGSCPLSKGWTRS